MTLQDRINSALADHLAEHGGGMVSAFHLAVEYVDAEGEEGWAFATAPDQRLSRTIGLVEWSRGHLRHEQRRYLEGLGDDA